MTNRPIIWSYGGGTQSAAIAVLVLQGRLPHPERIVMADTGREATETWEYLAGVVQPALKGIGLQVEIAPHSLATVDLYSTKGKILMPVYTAGGAGKLPTYCSNEWKARVVARHLRQKGYGPKHPVLNWLGMSTDELDRLNPDGAASWIRNYWPLVFDVPTNRSACKRLVIDYGWPEPPKSSCWMCPHRGNQQWRHLRENYPEDWRRAIELDEEIRQKDANAFVHRSGVPLAEADLEEEEAQGELFGCMTGFCFV